MTGLLCGRASVARLRRRLRPPVREVPGARSSSRRHPGAHPESQAGPASTAGAPALGFESDLYCFGYVGSRPTLLGRGHRARENIAEQTDFTHEGPPLRQRGIRPGLQGRRRVLDRDSRADGRASRDREGHGPLLPVPRARRRRTASEGRTAIAAGHQRLHGHPMGSVLKTFEPVPIPLARKTLPPCRATRRRGKPGADRLHPRRHRRVGADQHRHRRPRDRRRSRARRLPDDFPLRDRSEYGIRPVGAYWVTVPACHRSRGAAHLPGRDRRARWWATAGRSGGSRIRTG